MSKSSQKTFCYFPEVIKQLKPTDAKALPKPDPFFWFGELVPGTGCFVPNTDTLVPGTGCFQNKKGEYFIANGFHLTRGGTHYRITPIPLSQAVAKGLVESGNFNTKKIYDNLKRKEKYQRRVRQKRHTLKKSAIRFIKQIFDDSKEYKFDTFTKKQFAESRKKKLKAEKKKLAKAGQKKLGKEKDSQFKAEQKKAISASCNTDLKHYKSNIKTHIVTESLAKAFSTSTDTVSEIRTQRLKTQAMIIAGLLWKRGRRRQRRDPKPYTELRPIFQFDGVGLKGHVAYHRVVVENPQGSYARSGTPVQVTT